MKKLLSISDNVSKALEQHAKENRTTQSKVVEVAISLYLAMHQGAKAMSNQINSFTEQGKKDLFDEINKKK